MYVPPISAVASVRTPGRPKDALSACDATHGGHKSVEGNRRRLREGPDRAGRGEAGIVDRAYARGRLLVANGAFGVRGAFGGGA